MSATFQHRRGPWLLSPRLFYASARAEKRGRTVCVGKLSVAGSVGVADAPRRTGWLRKPRRTGLAMPPAHLQGPSRVRDV